MGLQVSIFPKEYVVFLFCDFWLRRFMIFFERLNPKDPLRSNHKLNALARFHLKMETLFFSGIKR